MPWTVPATESADYCLHISGHADGYSDSSSTGNIFAVTAWTENIFADDFESGGTTAWSSTAP